MQETPVQQTSEAVDYRPPMSLGARLMNVFAAPGEVFDDVREQPTRASSWLVPAMLTVLVGWISATIVFSIDSVQHQLTEITQNAVEMQIKKANISGQQAEQMRQAADKFAGVGAKVGGYSTPIVMAFTSPFIWGLFVWLVGSKVFRASFSYMKGVEAVGLGNMINVLELAVNTLLVIAFGSLFAGPNAALLVVRNFDPQNTMHGILAALNIMTLWLLAVRAVALSRLSGASFGRSAVWLFGIWIVYTGLFMAFGVIMRKIFGT